jgi:hypothetical protein
VKDSGRRFQVQGEASIAVVVVKEPPQTFAAHFETQVAGAGGSGRRFGQRLDQLDQPIPALRCSCFVQPLHVRRLNHSR